MTIAIDRTTDILLLDISTIAFTVEQFDRLCRANPDRALELTAQGELIIMPPVGGESGSYESEIDIDLGIWNRSTRLGKTFSSSTLFVLPDGSRKSPDVAWVELSRWEALTTEERKKFLPLAPDFVIELRSETDRLPPLQGKMLEYRDNGVRLGWLIDPQQQQVEIYRPGREVEVLRSPISLDGEDVLPGFVLDLSQIFQN
jgi:Uma2 family endonuclease